MIHDQFSDTSFRVFATKIRDFGSDARDLVKTAELDYEEAATLPESAFAWPEMRKFAMHTPEHAALSIIYATGENVPSHVRGNLEKAAELYNLNLKPVEKTAMVKEASAADYLLPDQKFGLITEKGHVKEASAFFAREYKGMDIQTRAQAAATLVKKARTLEAKISPSFLKHAGLTQCDTKVLGEWLEARAGLSPEGPIKEGFRKLAAHVQDESKFKYASRSDMIKIAETIGTLDDRADLVKRYDKTLPDPLLTVFNTSKIAAETVSIADKPVAKASLLAMDPQTYADILGADILPEITDASGNLKEDELIDVLQTLPADLQLLVASSLGV